MKQKIEFVEKSTLQVNGADRTVRVYLVSREGSKAPSYWYYKYGRRKKFVTPFEQRVRGWSKPGVTTEMLWLMKHRYRPIVSDLIHKENPLLALVRTYEWKGVSIPVPYGP